MDIGETRYQVMGYWDKDGYMVIGVRTMGGAWTLYTYDGVDQAATIRHTEDDPHNTINLGLDPNGYLHVAYDHHNDPLMYRRSNAPLDSWTGTLTSALSMVGTNENQVAYPMFINDPSGTLYVLFRDGGTGLGDLYFYKYAHATTTWSAAAGTGAGGKLINGKGASPDENPYWDKPTFDDDFGTGGYMHLTWVWRETETVSTIHDYQYVRWDGTNWTRIDNAAQTVPILPTNDETILAVAQGGGLSNINGLEADGQGRPHIAYFRSVDGYAQMCHLYHNGSVWIERVLTDTLTPQYHTAGQYGFNIVLRPLLLIDRATDQAVIVYGDSGDLAEGDGWHVLRSQPGDYTQWEHLLLVSGAGGAEPNCDYRYWRESGNIQMLFCSHYNGGTQWPIKLLEWIL